MTPIPSRFLLFAAAACVAAGPNTSQGQQALPDPPPSPLRGTVRDAGGRPLAGATIFLLETPDEALADSAGRFTLRVQHRGPVTIAARRIGYLPATLELTLPADTSLSFTLRAQPPTLRAMAVVAAGEYTLGTGQTATLTPLEVAQTPGAAANVARAIQTLPGTQAVDEGTGLFVRGGDVSETRVMVDGVTFLSPLRFDNPTGHVTATVDPFLLERTVFSAGGFGAAYGNALSGLVRMETAGRPTRTTGSVSAAIGSVGGALALAPSGRLGVRVAAKRTSLAALVAAFGAPQPYAPAPSGGDVSASVEWRTSARSRLKWFGLAQGSRFGVGEATASGPASFGTRSTERFSVLSWQDSGSALQPRIAVGHSRFRRDERIGNALLDTELANTQAVASLGWVLRDGLQLRGGGEFERLGAHYRGASGGTPGRPTFEGRPRLDRYALWSDGTWESARGLRVTLGMRSDVATRTGGRQWDPRTSLVYERGRLGLSAAWGRYTQVAEPAFFRPTSPSDVFTPMRAEQAIVGAQWGGDTLGLRLELYDKRYAGLWQFTRTYVPVGGGRGHARGADLMLRWRPFPSTTTRLTWSQVASRRSDPHSGAMARAIGDLTHSVTWVTETRLRGWSIGTARRWASGRPFTDVIGTVPAPDGVAPVWGPLHGARLPAYRRLDLSVSRYRGLGEGRGLVLYAQVSNLFDRANVMRYRWTPDYRVRIPVRAPFNRSAYVGASLLF